LIKKIKSIYHLSFDCNNLITNFFEDEKIELKGSINKIYLSLSQFSFLSFSHIAQIIMLQKHYKNKREECGFNLFPKKV
jgi:uncharacterized protein (UPF0335 family)